MKIKVDRFTPGYNAIIQKYKIFERKVYNRDTGKFITDHPIGWNDDPAASHGQYYYEDAHIDYIDKNYNLYAVWPEIKAYVYYNLFASAIKREAAIGAEYTLEDMSDEIEGFKGWLDRDMRFHLPGSTIEPTSNVQLFLSTCNEISITYDLNNGYLRPGESANPQITVYSKWVNFEYEIKDSDPTIAITANNPSIDAEDAEFGYWVIDGNKYYKGNLVHFKEDSVAYAQWLWTPAYSFSDSVECIGEHDPAFGRLTISDKTETAQTYTAIPEDGYKFDYFTSQLFDGYEWGDEERYDASSVRRVEITPYDRRRDDLTEKLHVQMHTVAYFSKDFDSWFRIRYADSHVRLVKKPDRSSQTVTDAMLHTAGDADIVYVQFPTNDVEHVENGIFANCTSLTEIQIASKLREFPADMCKNDIKFTTVSYSAFPSNLTAVGASAFEGCTSLVDIGQPLVDNIKTFGARAFAGTGIQSFTFGTDTTSVGNAIFSGTTRLTEFALKTSTLGVLGTAALDGSSVTKIILTNISSKDILGS